MYHSNLREEKERKRERPCCPKRRNPSDAHARKTTQAIHSRRSLSQTASKLSSCSLKMRYCPNTASCNSQSFIMTLPSAAFKWLGDGNKVPLIVVSCNKASTGSSSSSLLLTFRANLGKTKLQTNASDDDDSFVSLALACDDDEWSSVETTVAAFGSMRGATGG